MGRRRWLQELWMEKFESLLDRVGVRELSQIQAAEILGMSERTFRRWRVRFEGEGLDGLFDRRLGKASGRRVPVDEIAWMVEEYRTRHVGWTVKHFHDHLTAHHGFRRGYTWTKTQLHAAGLVAKAPRRGAHRRKRPRRPLVGMMVHQDGSTHAWLEGPGTARPDRHPRRRDLRDLLGLPGRRGGHGLELRGPARSDRRQGPAVRALHRPRRPLLPHRRGRRRRSTRTRPTQVGRALAQLGIEHIPAYSPEARGRSERAFATLQDRLVKELKLAGITTIEDANRFIAEVYLPDHNARFRKAPRAARERLRAGHTRPGPATSCADRRSAPSPTTTPCATAGLCTADPAEPDPAALRQGQGAGPPLSRTAALAVFHGPRRLASYTAAGELIANTNTLLAA